MPTNKPDYRSKNNWENYKKYQKGRSDYRAKLNQANRDRGTYGNGDGKDLKHVDGNPKNFAKSNLRMGSMTENRKEGAEKANRNKKQQILARKRKGK